MSFLFWKTKPAEPAHPDIEQGSLAQHAITCLQKAAQVQPENPDLFVEERVIWQPDSWLLQRCWQALADGGAGEEALAVVALLEPRSPLARAQALYRLAQQLPNHPDLTPLVRRELQQARLRLFAPWTPGDESRQVDRLLLLGAAAALVGDPALAFACLERADQSPRVWDRVMVTAELRGLLAEIVARVGLHPLTNQLITLAIRRYEETGAQFLHQILTLIGPRLAREQLPRRTAKLMQRCVDTFQFATLASLTSRRLAAGAFGQAGLVHDVLAQLTTIANVQEARRESGLSSGKGDPHFLRQVKRPTANPDIDFQVYTLQEAVRAMPVRSVSREERIALADQLAILAVQSDGWTAASAAASLVELGALKYAVNVVDHIPAQDPTRSEGVLSLVRALLDFGDPQLAEEQANKAVAWVKSLDRRNPERATIWGLAEIYLAHNMPEMALRLLAHRYTPPTFGDRVRRAFHNPPSDDELRDNRLRFQALLQQGAEWNKELQALYDQLCRWAPRLLDGEMLMNFYLEGLLRPLLAVGRIDLVWPLLPQVRDALSASSGDKHAMQVQRVATLLAKEAAAHFSPDRLAMGATPALERNGEAPATTPNSHDLNRHDPNGQEPAEYPSDGDESKSDHAESNHAAEGNADRYAPDVDPFEAHAALGRFMVELWQADVQKGLWQIIHGIEGTLSLLLALEGPDALVVLAQAAAKEGGQWTQ